MSNVIWNVYVHICIFALGMIAYGIGSIPTGYLLVKKLKNVDIREVGSGSTGATNVKRVLGMKGFVAVMLLDLLKGILPILLAKWVELNYWIYPSEHIIPVVVALGLVIGHSKSLFLNFTGGKSVATGVGTLVGLCWQAGLIVMLVWLAITYFSKYVSVGSIIAVMLAPILLWKFAQPQSYIIFSLVGCLYIIYLHRENIKRLISGEENKVRS